MLCLGSLTAPQGPVRHWWDWLRGRFLVLVFGEDGGRESLERDGHWDMAQSCSVAGRSSGSHSLAFTSWSLKLTHSTCRVVFPWPQVTEHWQHKHMERVKKWKGKVNANIHKSNWHKKESWLSLIADSWHFCSLWPAGGQTRLDEQNHVRYKTMSSSCYQRANPDLTWC